MKPNLARLSRRIDSSLTMRVLIYREGPLVTDPDTLEDTATRETVWQGPALVYAQMTAEKAVVVASAVYRVSDYDVILPVSATFKTGDTLEITESPDNPAMVGKTLVVRDDPLDGWQIARRAVAQLIA